MYHDDQFTNFAIAHDVLTCILVVVVHNLYKVVKVMLFFSQHESHLLLVKLGKDKHIWGCTIMMLIFLHASMTPFAILAWLASIM